MKKETHSTEAITTADDGHVDAVQICSDDEKLEKLQTRRRNYKRYGCFDDVTKALDELCIRVEYIIYDSHNNHIAAG